MTHNTLFITSFNQQLYEKTGKEMVESFFKHNPELKLLVCYEEFNYNQHDMYPNLIKYNLVDSKFLNNWLKDNLDVIPESFGGKVPDKKFDVWNFRASKWFRKIASFQIALTLYGNQYNSLVWIDCDSLIQNQFPLSLISDIFSDGNNQDMVDVFYHFGEERRKINTGFESGVIGFRQGNGYKVLEKVFECYVSKYYRNIIRWDDGYVFRIIIEALESKNLVKTVDLIDNKHILHKVGKKRDAINKGIFSNYIIHKKGVHKDLF
jgi:hypothetical protein